MRKFFLTVMASLLSCSAAYAFWPEATDSSLEIGVGYRQDSLKWRTGHSGSGSNCGSCYNDYQGDYGSQGGYERHRHFRSELKWRDLQICEIEARGYYVTCDNLYLRAHGDYGWITSGKNHDKDFVGFGGGSEREFSRSSSRVKGHVYDLNVAIGYQFKLCDCSLSIAPLVGYSWNGQHFHDHHLKHHCSSEYTCNDPSYYYTCEFTEARSRCCDESYSYYTPCQESYSGCNDSCDYSYGGNHSRYNTRWIGPFIGFDFDYRFWCDWSLFGDYEFHWAEYHARGRWDLRQDLCKGFRHHSKNAYGQVIDIGLRWDFCDCWNVAIKGEFQWWYANHGHDRALIAQGSLCDAKTKCYLTIPLRHVRWNSGAVLVDLGLVF